MTCVTKAVLREIATNPKNAGTVAEIAHEALAVFVSAETSLTSGSVVHLATLCHNLDVNGHGALLDYLKTGHPDCCAVCKETARHLENT